MFKRVLIILFISIAAIVNGQGNEIERDSKITHVVQFTFGGAGVHYSVMYEALVFTTPSLSAGVKTGLGTSLSRALSPPEISIPVGGILLVGKGTSKLCIGLSFTGYLMGQYDYESNKNYLETQPLIIPSLAYRYQKKEGGLTFHAGLSPLIHVNTITPVYTPWVDLGVGYAFGKRAHKKQRNQGITWQFEQNQVFL